VTAVRVISGPGTEIQWAGAEIAVVAATSEEVANDALRKIKVEYEGDAPSGARRGLGQGRSRAPKRLASKITGDPIKASRTPTVVMEGQYGIPVLTHCCLESHGQAAQWSGDTIQYWPSTQNVSGIGGDLAKSLQLPATQVKVHMDHVGGGFGSKFAADKWGVECTQLSKDSGGKPVKLFLDRATELKIGGVRLRRMPRSRSAPRKTARSPRGNPIPGPVAASPVRQSAVAVRVHQHRQPAQEPHGGFDQRRRRSRLARSQPSAGLLSHRFGDRRSGRQTQHGPGRCAGQECGPHASPRSLSAAASKSRRE